MKLASILMLCALLCGTFATQASAEKAATGPDALAIDQACTTEASTAGCGDKKVGTGLLKCIHAYKKEHRKEFKLSEGCKSAMKKAHEDYKEKKGE